MEGYSLWLTVARSCPGGSRRSAQPNRCSASSKDPRQASAHPQPQLSPQFAHLLRRDSTCPCHTDGIDARKSAAHSTRPLAFPQPHQMKSCLATGGPAAGRMSRIKIRIMFQYIQLPSPFCLQHHIDQHAPSRRPLHTRNSTPAPRQKSLA